MNRNSGFMPNHRYLVENVKESVREPGEWYLDRAAEPWTLTYIPKPGEIIAKTSLLTSASCKTTSAPPRRRETPPAT